jgi:hypothetical protein
VGTGQILSLMAAFVLLSRLLLSVNDAAIFKTELVNQAEATLYATTLAQATVQEVTLKDFDQNTTSKAVPSPDSLTLAKNLGPEVGEVFSKYNDLDDFNGYKRTVANPRLGNFQSAVRVTYAAANGDSTVDRTYYKRITVTVSDISKLTLKIPVELTRIISY